MSLLVSYTYYYRRGRPACLGAAPLLCGGFPRCLVSGLGAQLVKKDTLLRSLSAYNIRRLAWHVRSAPLNWYSKPVELTPYNSN